MPSVIRSSVLVSNKVSYKNVIISDLASVIVYFRSSPQKRNSRCLGGPCQRYPPAALEDLRKLNAAFVGALAVATFAPSTAPEIPS